MQVGPGAASVTDLSNFLMALQPPPQQQQQLHDDVSVLNALILDARQQQQQRISPTQQQSLSAEQSADASLTKALPTSKKTKRARKPKEITEKPICPNADDVLGMSDVAHNGTSDTRSRNMDCKIPLLDAAAAKLERSDSDGSNTSIKSSSGSGENGSGGKSNGNELARSKKLINMLNSRENRKRKRQELTSLKDHSKEMELLQKLLGSFSRLILVHDKAGDIVFATSTGLIQYDQKDLVGRNLYDISVINSAYKERSSKNRPGEKKKRRSKRLKLRKPDGTYIPCKFKMYRLDEQFDHNLLPHNCKDAIKHKTANKKTKKSTRKMSNDTSATGADMKAVESFNSSSSSPTDQSSEETKYVRVCGLSFECVIFKCHFQLRELILQICFAGDMD
jgi:hypothetical protein